VNDAVRVQADGLLTTSDLAARSDFTLGLAIVSPSSRTMVGPGGTADVEPRVMQVLLVLADGAGQVVTRESLFQRCWGGVYVGDDSLNRAIAAVRKLASGIAGNSFEIETIPRTGYRLSGAKVGIVQADGPRAFTRRQLVAATLGIAALGSLGAWAALSSRDQRRFDALMAQGTKLASDGNVYDPARARMALEEAVRLRPESAAAWGWLAFTRSVLGSQGDPTQSVAAVESAQQAIHRSLTLDPKEPNALLAMFELQGSTLDWWARDRKLREVIAIDPANVNAIAELVLMLQAAGLNGESWNWNERALQLQPLSQDFLGKRALKHWIAGRISASDQVIDQLRGLYPASEWAWWIRFMLYALTNRPLAAKAMLERKPDLSSPELTMWRKAVEALISPTSRNTAATRAECEKVARISGDLAGQGVMILSALGEVDGAFAIANGFLLSQGSIIRGAGPPEPTAEDNLREMSDAIARINTQWLFTPPCSIMRSDPRFLQLCDGRGLLEYWRRRGVRPDYQLQR
jgi:DNA-binding winged helix-turn-helix (wHTH) protein/tetratricopeptide (TPR) repeat protein